MHYLFTPLVINLNIISHYFVVFANSSSAPKLFLQLRVFWSFKVDIQLMSVVRYFRCVIQFPLPCITVIFLALIDVSLL